MMTGLQAERIERVCADARSHGLPLEPADVVTEGLPEDWAIVPWPMTKQRKPRVIALIIPPADRACSGGWTAEAVGRRKKVVKVAREEIARHVAGCFWCAG